MFWIKLNIYSLLLSLLALIVILVFCKTSALYEDWKNYIVFIAVYFMLVKAVDIFNQFQEKKEIYYKLLGKARNHYDQRYFIPYMGTACMRSLVFWVLTDLKKQKDYFVIRKRFERELLLKTKNKTALPRLGPPKVMDIVMDRHEIKFISFDLNKKE